MWFYLGMEHIADWSGYDHMLFLLVLCGVYKPQQWRQLLILITAFTVGHSITLALSALDVLIIPSAIIEFLIPVTILATAVGNLFRIKATQENMKLNYLFALCFGCIHGLGFSYLLKSLLGKEESIVYPLFAFNIGIEAGQILIVGVILLLSWLAHRLFTISERDKNFFLSSAVFGISLIMAIERLPV
jgi:hypothetical protein